MSFFSKIIKTVFVLTFCFTQNVTSASEVELSVGYENSPEGPFGLGIQKWKELLEEKSNGSMSINSFSFSLLGSKQELLDQMVAGEPVCTLTDGAFFADRGVNDMGIMFAPYLFSSWEQAFNLSNSDWYKKLSDEVLKKSHIKIIASNWKYGARQILTTKPLYSLADFKDLKIRVPNNIIQQRAFEVLGAKPVPMPLSDVYDALEKGEIEGLENPLSVLYNGQFYDIAKYLLLDNHILNMTNIVVGETFWNSLTEDQQNLLVETCKEAGNYQNSVLEKQEELILERFKSEGVEILVPSLIFKQSLVNASQKFYDLNDFKKWTPNLYDTVRANLNN